MDYEAFGKVLLSCANGDGRISAAERAWVLGFLDAYGAPQPLLESLESYPGTDGVAKLVSSSPTVKMSATARSISAMGLESRVVRDLVELYHDEQHQKGRRLRAIFPNGIPFQG